MSSNQENKEINKEIEVNKEENTQSNETKENRENSDKINEQMLHINEEDETIDGKLPVKKVDIPNKRGNYIFTIGHIGSSKSTIQNLLVYRLHSRSDITFDYVNREGGHLHAATLNKWVDEIRRGKLPRRTAKGEFQEFTISFSQQKTRRLELNFLEISGEDIISIIPELSEKEKPKFHENLELYLRNRHLRKRFLFVSDSTVNRLNKDYTTTKGESEDVLFKHILEFLLGKHHLNMRKIDVLFVVGKWDIVRDEYNYSVEEYMDKNFPRTQNILMSSRCNTQFIDFSVGEIDTIEDEFTKKKEEKITRFEWEHIDFITHWVYHSFTGNLLKNYPKIKKSFFDYILNIFGIK